MKENIALCISAVLLAGLVFCSGCVTSPSPGNATAATPAAVPSVTPFTTQPAAMPSLSPAVATTGPVMPSVTTVMPVTTATWVQTTYGATGDPRIIILEFRKEYFTSNIPDCGMRAAFPGAAADPEYGISGRNGKLVAYTEDQMRTFLAANAITTVNEIQVDPNLTNYIDPNTLGGAACSGTVSTPTWNFVLINATIMGRNARPSEYAIGFNVRSRGNVVAQIRADRNMTLDQPAFFALYVPLKTDETDLFDGVEMVFRKKG